MAITPLSRVNQTEKKEAVESKRIRERVREKDWEWEREIHEFLAPPSKGFPIPFSHAKFGKKKGRKVREKKLLAYIEIECSEGFWVTALQKNKRHYLDSLLLVMLIYNHNSIMLSLKWKFDCCCRGIINVFDSCKQQVKIVYNCQIHWSWWVSHINL